MQMLRSCFIAMICCLCLSACYETEYPLNERGTALAADTNLIGEWIKRETSSSTAARLEVSAASGQQLQFRYHEADREPLEGILTFSELDGRRYASAKPQGSEKYILLSYGLKSKGELALQLLRTDAPRFESSRKLREFMSENKTQPQVFLEPQMIFKRKS